MTPSERSKARIERLLMLHETHSLGEDEALELEQLLRQSAAARAHLVASARLTSQLAREANIQNRRRRNTWLGASTTAAAAALLALWLVPGAREQATSSRVDPSALSAPNGARSKRDPATAGLPEATRATEQGSKATQKPLPTAPKRAGSQLAAGSNAAEPHSERDEPAAGSGMQTATQATLSASHKAKPELWTQAKDSFGIPEALPEWVARSLLIHRSTPSGVARWNQPTWRCAGAQRYILQGAQAGIAARDVSWIHDGWKAVAPVFARQTETGGVQDSAVCLAQFLQALMETLRALEGSSVDHGLQAEIAALDPRIKSAVTWLTKRKDLSASVKNVNRANPWDLTLTTAAVLADASQTQSDAELKSRAITLADSALEDQGLDGRFYLNGVHDSLHQTHQVAAALHLAAVLPLPRYVEAARKGGQWLRTRVREDGNIDLAGNRRTPVCNRQSPGVCTISHYQELRRALIKHAVRFGESASWEAADRVRAFLARTFRGPYWQRRFAAPQKPAGDQAADAPDQHENDDDNDDGETDDGETDDGETDDGDARRSPQKPTSPSGLKP